MDIKTITADALTGMMAAGFDEAQVGVGVHEMDELNIAYNEPSLLRSTEGYSVNLTGIVDGRKASASLTDLSSEAIQREIASLTDRAKLAPQDDANAVSRDQQGHFVKGPQTGDRDVLTAKVNELLAFRAADTPKMNIDEGNATYSLSHRHLMTSGGSSIESHVGCYGMGASGTATDGDASSSFNYAGGNADDLTQAPAQDWFGISDMMRETEAQIHTVPVGEKFTGEIVLAPGAVMDLVSWLFSQLQDRALIAGASVFRDRVGETIASPLMTLHSRFEGPGLTPYNGDGFITNPITVIEAGRLELLMPSYYGSLKTGIAHTPTAFGWRIPPGDTPLENLTGSIRRGAMVNRLSMGAPAANGDFSAVVKNSFLIEDGQIGAALSDSMIAGNMADMLRDIDAVSSEHRNYGGIDYPWMRIPGLQFS
jgi:PmbA protein